MPKLKGEFTVQSWNEETYAEREGGRKVTRATVGAALSGGIEGAAEVTWLMSYADDGTARYVGLQVVEGTLDDREGGAVIESSGSFDGKRAQGGWTVVPGSGTGGWEGLTGE